MATKYKTKSPISRLVYEISLLHVKFFYRIVPPRYLRLTGDFWDQAIRYPMVSVKF